MRTSGANRNPKLRNSEFVQIPIWNLDGQRCIVSDKIGQPLKSYMPLKILPMNLPKFIGNMGRLSSPRIRIYLTDQSGTEEYERNVDNIVAKCITGINFCFTLATIICKFGQFLDRIMFRTVLDGQLTPTLDIEQTLDRHFLKPAPLMRTQVFCVRTLVWYSCLLAYANHLTYANVGILASSVRKIGILVFFAYAGGILGLFHAEGKINATPYTKTLSRETLRTRGR